MASNCLGEQALAAMRDEVELDRRPSRTLPIDCNLAGVAAERVNVLLNPLERLDLVVEARIEVAEALAGDLRGSVEADRVESVVHGRDDDVDRRPAAHV